MKARRWASDRLGGDADVASGEDPFLAKEVNELRTRAVALISVVVTSSSRGDVEGDVQDTSGISEGAPLSHQKAVRKGSLGLLGMIWKCHSLYAGTSEAEQESIFFFRGISLAKETVAFKEARGASLRPFVWFHLQEGPVGMRRTRRGREKMEMLSLVHTLEEMEDAG